MTRDPSRRQGFDPTDPYYHATLVKGEGVVTFCREERGVEITEQLVKRAAESGRLAYSIISGRRCFSRADVDSWLLSKRRPATAGQDAVSA